MPTTNPDPAHSAELIFMGYPRIHSDGSSSFAVGVQLVHDGEIERYAVTTTTSETRASLTTKLRLLADALSTGSGAVLGEDFLCGRELNAADFPPIDHVATIEKWPPDFAFNP